MGVFDGGTYRVDVYWEGEDDKESTYTDDPRTLVESLRGGSDVKAVETYRVSYVLGACLYDLCFGDPEGEEDA